MKISSIKAKNFRTLEDAIISFNGDYCAISGKNNAGKSCIISLLSHLFYKESFAWSQYEDKLNYKSDLTQWVKGVDENIEITYNISLNKKDDASLITFLEKIFVTSSSKDESELIVFIKLQKEDTLLEATYESKKVDKSLAKDVIQKLKTSNLMFLHNSTTNDDVYYGRGKRMALVEFVLSEHEKQQVIQAEASIQNKIKRFAKQHKDEIQGLLGKMQEKHSVELTTIDSSYSRHIPLSVRLQDGQVDAPINDWGSGTQNKTYILLSMLWANRVKNQHAEEDKITPIVVIEEPESFLHPTAQAEFGKLLSSIALDLGIQIIVTTHSPYMLNRAKPSSNILVTRPVKRNKLQGSQIIIPSNENWMAPFSEHLGIPAKEFEQWKPLFSTGERNILLVEGPIDVEYFDHISKHKLVDEKLDESVEVIPYGGKDALKNTILLKFTLDKYDSSYITFDLDVLQEVKRAIEAIGYVNGKTYFPVGLDKPGHKDIEGLLPETIRSKVFSSNTELVTAAIGNDKNAKDQLKKKYLEEFKSRTTYQKEDLKEFQKLIKTINKGIKLTKARQ